MHYNRSNSFIFINAGKTYQLKAKHFEIKPYPLCNIPKNFTINDMKMTGLKRSVRVFFVDYNAIDTSHILDMHKYLMKKNHPIK